MRKRRSGGGATLWQMNIGVKDDVYTRPARVPNQNHPRSIFEKGNTHTKEGAPHG